MKIILVPRVIVINKSQIEYSIDENWYKFLKNVFYKPKIFLPYDQFSYKEIDLIIIGGGNDLNLIIKNESNQAREKISKKFFNIALKNNIPLIGVCYGAQFIASYFKCKIGPVKNHTKDHEIVLKNINDKKFKKKYLVNSYHNFGILKSGKNINNLAISTDNSIELFIHNKFKMLGIMWHPERYKKFKLLDKDLFRLFVKSHI